MLKSIGLAAAFIGLSILFFAVLAQPQPPQKLESVIIKASRPYTKLVSDIQALGGRVKKQYKHVEAIAAEIPSRALLDLMDLAGPEAVSTDLIVPLASRVDPTRGKRAGAKNRNSRSKSVASTPVTFSGSNPYLVNNAGLNLQSLHSAGWTGRGVVVAIIDTGLRPGFPHIAGSVIGCENFVDDPGDPGRCSDAANDPHGTFVAGLVAAHADFDLTGTDLLASIQQHLPAAVRDNRFLSLVGSAPGASIYAMRVFAPGAG